LVYQLIQGLIFFIILLDSYNVFFVKTEFPYKFENMSFYVS